MSVSVSALHYPATRRCRRVPLSAPGRAAAAAPARAGPRVHVPARRPGQALRLAEGPRGRRLPRQQQQCTTRTYYIPTLRKYKGQETEIQVYLHAI